MNYDPGMVATRRLGRFRWEASHPVGWKSWIVKYGRTRRSARRALRRCLHRR